MEKVVLIINGKPLAGKDTLTSLLSEKYKIKNISSIDKIKAAAYLLGWNGNKDDKGRTLLHEIKQALIKYDDLPFKYMKEEISNFLNNGIEEILILHIREEPEIEKIYNYLINERIKVIKIFIENKNTDILEWSNVSDKIFNKDFYDIILDNSDFNFKGSEDLINTLEEHITKNK